MRVGWPHLLYYFFFQKQEVEMYLPGFLKTKRGEWKLQRDSIMFLKHIQHVTIQKWASVSLKIVVFRLLCILIQVLSNICSQHLQPVSPASWTLKWCAVSLLLCLLSMCRQASFKWRISQCRSWNRCDDVVSCRRRTADALVPLSRRF